MITKAQIEALKRQRPTPRIHQTYAPEGSLQTLVHQRVERERIEAVKQGEQILSNAVARFRSAMLWKARKGLAQSRFKQSASQKLRSRKPTQEKSR